LFVQVLVHQLVFFVQANLGIGCLAHCFRAQDMIEVGVRMQQVFDLKPIFFEDVQDVLHVTTGIDDGSFARLLASDD
jgi:hypothetical protein